MGYSLQTSTSDQMSSALDFNQGFGGINKSRQGIGKFELAIGGAVLLGLVYLLTKGGK